MIFTSSYVTSFQDYRLQEKSIQNTILAAGLCSLRMLTFLPGISDSQLSQNESRTHTIKKKREREKDKEEEEKNPTSVMRLVFWCWAKPLSVYKPN